jgi:hypothetical protein
MNKNKLNFFTQFNTNQIKNLLTYKRKVFTLDLQHLKRIFKKLTQKEANNIRKKLSSGNYYHWVGKWSNVYGQQLSIWPTNAYIKRNKTVKPIITHYQILTPFDKSKKGRFTVFSGSGSNLVYNYT